MSGRIEVIVGSMFSGKSEELIRRLQRARYAKQKVVSFKPSIDIRYDENQIASNSGLRQEALPIQTAEDIRALVGDAQVVGIDEAQFIDGIVEIVQDLASAGKRVLVAGLDMDYRGIPFGPIPHLMAIAEQVDKIHAVCMECGREASMSQRISASEEQVLIGATGVYEARCRAHWSPYPIFGTRADKDYQEG